MMPAVIHCHCWYYHHHYRYWLLHGDGRMTPMGTMVVDERTISGIRLMGTMVVDERTTSGIRLMGTMVYDGGMILMETTAASYSMNCHCPSRSLDRLSEHGNYLPDDWMS
jgi:hypothetical protein